MGFFRSCWNLAYSLGEKGVDTQMVNLYAPNVFAGRNQIMGGGYNGRKDLEPFDGDYDYMLWFDTDMVFTPEDVDKLLEADVDIISGTYVMGLNKDALVAGYWHDRGRLKLEDLPEDEVVPVGYVGWGMVLVKRGVFEAIGYPWLIQQLTVNGDMVQDLSDDFGFCLRAGNAGYKIHLHTGVLIGHEKVKVAWPER